jgi:voltage-gated sodium channel
VLNVLIGIVLNAMDQARTENEEKSKQLDRLEQIVQLVDDAAADGDVTQEEIRLLREKIKELEAAAEKRGT